MNRTIASHGEQGNSHDSGQGQRTNVTSRGQINVYQDQMVPSQCRRIRAKTKKVQGNLLLLVESKKLDVTRGAVKHLPLLEDQEKIRGLIIKLLRTSKRRIKAKVKIITFFHSETMLT